MYLKKSIKVISFLLIFTVFSMRVKAKIEGPIGDSIIYTMDQNDTAYIPEDYQWTFATSNINSNNVEYCENCDWYLKSTDFGTCNNDYCEVNKNIWNLNPKIAISHSPDEDSVIYMLKKDGDGQSIKYCSGDINGDISDVYIYYPFVGTYNNKQVGLKITLIDYVPFNKMRVDDNKYSFRPSVKFSKNVPQIDMQGLNSAQFKYEFIDNEKYEKSKSFNDAILNNIKGYGTLEDIDAGQAIVLNRQNNSATDLNGCQTNRLNSIGTNNGIYRAYIYKTADNICTDYRTRKTRCAGSGNECDEKNLATVYKYNSYGSNTGACANTTDNIYAISAYSRNLPGYSYLIPNYISNAAVGEKNINGDVSYALKEDLIFSEGVGENKTGKYLYYVNEKSAKAEGSYKGVIDVYYKYRKNTISSPPMIAKQEKYSWIQILFNGSFSISYYFADLKDQNYQRAWCNGYSTTGEKKCGADQDKDGYKVRTYDVSAYNNVDGNEYEGGSGGAFFFKSDTLLKKKLDVMYRTINTANPFLDVDGNIRNTGSNWCSNDSCSGDPSKNSKVKQYITDKKDSNSKDTAEYTYELDADTIKNIRKCSEDDYECIKSQIGEE